MKPSMLLLIALTVSSMPAFSQKKENCDDEDQVSKLAKEMSAVTEKAKPCGNESDMKYLCNAITGMTPNHIKGTDRLGRYEYHQLLYKAACVTNDDIESDDEAILQKKMQTLWNKQLKTINCKGLGIPGSENILKIAAHGGFDDLMADVTANWKVDLNYQDPKDNYATLLDYIDAQLAGGLGPETKKKFTAYRDWVVNAGGKKSSELKK